MERWEGRVAIVTGASAGIGAGIARMLTEKGMKVIGVARRAERVEAMANELKGCKGELHAVKCDIGNEEDVVRVVKWAREKLGGADVLVNNAGVAPPCELSSFNTKDVQSILNTNIFGLCLFTREVIKDMRDRGVDDGHIFHINSTSGQRICAEPTGLYVYAGSKHAIRVMTEGLRRELRDLGTKIRVTSVSPGLVRSEIFGDGELAEQMFTENPTLEPRDIADALVYALSTPPHVQVHEITVQPVGELY